MHCQLHGHEGVLALQRRGHQFRAPGRKHQRQEARSSLAGVRLSRARLAAALADYIQSAAHRRDAPPCLGHIYLRMYMLCLQASC